MTWSVQIVKGDGTASSGNYHVCADCVHWLADMSNGRSPCLVNAVGAWQIGPLLTAVDVGRDGHMASGQAVLKCSGFQEIP